MENKLSVAVVGGGAAGMVCAIFLKRNGEDVTLFEKNPRLGKKLGITGKGRCNVTNNCSVPDFIANVPTNPKFLYAAISGFTPQETINFFENELKVPLKTERGNRVFPASDNSGDVVNALQKELQRLKVKIINKKVSSIKAEDGVITGLTVANGEDEEFLPFNRIVLCTGGVSYPGTGSTGDGHTFAKQLGIEVTKLSPSLVPLVIKEDFCGKMQGLSLKNTALTLVDKRTGKEIFSDFGEILFTHYGVSGPMALSASSHIRNVERDRYEIVLDLKPALDEQKLDNRILSDFEKYKNRDYANALDDLFPKKMIPVIIELSKIPPDKKVNSITREERKGLVSLIKNFKMTVSDFRPINEAIITSGGVSVKEIDPKTMECKKVKGLFFAGEIIDVDAYTGGFNLQIAFSTAYLAAKSAAKAD